MYLINIAGKIYYQESRGKSFKAYVKKQDTYYWRCKTRTDNKLITTKQVVDKLIAQKSGCVDCDSKKSLFEKQYKPDKKKKQFLKVTKHAHLLWKL